MVFKLNFFRNSWKPDNKSLESSNSLYHNLFKCFELHSQVPNGMLWEFLDKIGWGFFFWNVRRLRKWLMTFGVSRVTFLWRHQLWRPSFYYPYGNWGTKENLKKNRYTKSSTGSYVIFSEIILEELPLQWTMQDGCQFILAAWRASLRALVQEESPNLSQWVLSKTTNKLLSIRLDLVHDQENKVVKRSGVN